MSIILIADACKATQQELWAPLQDVGFEVHVAGDGYEALAACATIGPDLVLVDQGLPGMAGSEICHRLKSQPGTRDIISIVMAEDPQALIQAPYYGAQGTLAKPVPAPLLVEKITSLLAPVPEPSQMVTLRTNSLIISGQTVRVLHGTELTLAVSRDNARHLGNNLDSKQAVFIEYEPDEGSKVRREVFVSYIGANEILLSLSAKVNVEHRRRYFRKTLDVAVHYRLPGELVRVGRTLDISGGGMRLTGVRGKPELGMIVDLQLIPHPAMRLSLRGTIRRIDPSNQGYLGAHPTFDLAVEFEDMPVKMLQQLIVFLFCDPNGLRA